MSISAVGARFQAAWTATVERVSAAKTKMIEVKNKVVGAVKHVWDKIKENWDSLKTFCKNGLKNQNERIFNHIQKSDFYKLAAGIGGAIASIKIASLIFGPAVIPIAGMVAGGIFLLTTLHINNRIVNVHNDRVWNDLEDCRKKIHNLNPKNFRKDIDDNSKDPRVHLLKLQKDNHYEHLETLGFKDIFKEYDTFLNNLHKPQPEIFAGKLKGKAKKLDAYAPGNENIKKLKEHIDKIGGKDEDLNVINKYLIRLHNHADAEISSAYVVMQNDMNSYTRALETPNYKLEKTRLLGNIEALQKKLCPNRNAEVLV